MCQNDLLNGTFSRQQDHLSKEQMHRHQLCKAPAVLLNDTTLRAHQYHIGLAETKVCECNQGVEDVYHFFFQCTCYKDARKQLLQSVHKSWSDAGCKGSPHWSVTLRLAPSYLGLFSSEQSHDILFAMFDYIYTRLTGRRL